MKYLQNLVLLCGFALAAEHVEDSFLYEGSHGEEFVSRWAFQERCAHTYDVGSRLYSTHADGVFIDTDAVQVGDIIFARNPFMFFRDIMPKIKHPFILVTSGDSKDQVLKKHLKYLDNQKLIAWYCIHPYDSDHPKLKPIPLGVSQKLEHLEERVEFNTVFKELRATHKESLLHMNFRGSSPPVRADRDLVSDLFSDQPFCTKVKPKGFEHYMDEMATYKFTLSPQGTGSDTFRTWEALLVGTIPIIKTSHVDPLYKDLPVLIVDTWEDVTEAFLHEKYREITSRTYRIEKLFIEYWWTQIEQERDSFLADYTRRV